MAAASDPSGGGVQTGPSFQTRGLLQSTTTLPAREAASVPATSTATVPGTARNTTCAHAAASRGAAEDASLHWASSALTSASGLTPNFTERPPFDRLTPNPPPTFPAPMMATFVETPMVRPLPFARYVPRARRWYASPRRCKGARHGHGVPEIGQRGGGVGRRVACACAS